MNEIKHIITNSAAETQQLAEIIGRALRGGETIELSSDVGGGKTTFVHGLAKGAGSSDHVSSPTFTISNVYHTPEFSIHHFDFYRLPEAGLIEHELEENVTDKNDVVVVEWSDIVEHVLPEERLTIHIKSKGEESREFEISYPASLEYLTKEATDVDTRHSN